MFSVFVKYFSIIFLGIFLLSCIDGYAICPSTIKSIVTLQHNKRVREKKAKRQKEKMENERLENSACRKKSLFGEEFDSDEREQRIHELWKKQYIKEIAAEPEMHIVE